MIEIKIEMWQTILCIMGFHHKNKLMGYEKDLDGRTYQYVRCSACREEIKRVYAD